MERQQSFPLAWTALTSDYKCFLAKKKGPLDTEESECMPEVLLSDNQPLLQPLRRLLKILTRKNIFWDGRLSSGGRHRFQSKREKPALELERFFQDFQSDVVGRSGHDKVKRISPESCS